MIEPGNEYWVAYKFYLGEDQLVVPVEGGETQWMTIMSPAYGAPWGGSGPMTLALAVRTQNGVFQNQNIIQMSGNSGILGPVVMPFGSWVQLLFHFKFDYEGWVELWWHRPAQGWQRLRIYNTDGPYPWATRKAGTNDTGTNYNNLGVYGTTSHRTNIMCHRIGTTLYDVNYASDGWIPITL